MVDLIDDDEVLVLVPATLGPEATDALRVALGSGVRVMPRAELGRVGVTICVAAIARKHDLTPRHCDVLDGVLRGDSNEEIAAELGITVGTVKTHIEEMLRRTRSRNRQRLVGLAFGRDLRNR